MILIKTMNSSKLDLFQRYVMLLVVLMMVPGACCFYQFSDSRESDVLLAAYDATISVLNHDSMAKCSVIFVTDGDVDFNTLNKIFESIGIDRSIAIFKLTKEDRNNITLLQPSQTLESISQVRQTSRCTTLVVGNDDKDFLKVFIEGIVENHVLPWPTKLLVVTRLSRLSLSQVQQHLSSINAMIITLDDKQRIMRCGVHMYMPYSYKMIQVASWTKDFGIIYNGDLQLYPDKFRKFPDGAHFAVAGMNYPPHLKIGSLSSTGDEKGLPDTGPMKFLIEMMASNANFTYNIIQPTEGNWGFVSPNGTWNGMIGMVLRKEVDFALGPFARLYIRSTVVDYSDPLIVIYARIVGRRGNTEVDPWSFVMPLAPMVWAGTFATLVVILIIIILVSQMILESDSSYPKISLGTYIRAFLQQNIDVNSDNGWERMLLGGWMLTVLILLEAYSTNLISLLAVRHIKEPYHSIRQVMDDPSVKMLWFSNSAYIQFLAAADSGIFREVYDSISTGKIVLMTPAEYVPFVDEKVGRGDHVVIHPYISMKLFLTEDFVDEQGSCKFYVSRDRFMPMDFSPIVAKHSPLRIPMNEAIRAVVEGGLYDYWLLSTMTNPKSCKNPPTKITVKAALSLTNIWGMFVALVVGYITSLIAICLEIVYSKLPMASSGTSASVVGS